MDYETKVNTELKLKGNMEVYDRTKWVITEGRVEWCGGENAEEIGRYLEELMEDVFNAKVQIEGRVEWEGEDDKDFGYFEVGRKVKCYFGEK